MWREGKVRKEEEEGAGISVSKTCILGQLFQHGKNEEVLKSFLISFTIAWFPDS